MPFSEEPKPRKSAEETAERTGADYIKFSSLFRTVIRILDKEALTVWKHYFPQGNAGRGFGAVCPNVPSEGLYECPSELSVSHLPRESQERKDATARRKFIVNVLDRTPFTTCPHCNTETPGLSVPGTRDKQCINCKGSLKGADFFPLNKVKVLEQGPNLFNKQLNPIEKMQLEEHDVDITEYDIAITATGEGRDRTLSALPLPIKKLEDGALLDRVTGEEQTLYDLELLGQPASVEEITAIMQGATIEQLTALRGG